MSKCTLNLKKIARIWNVLHKSRKWAKSCCYKIEWTKVGHAWSGQSNSEYVFWYTAECLFLVLWWKPIGKRNRLKVFQIGICLSLTQAGIRFAHGYFRDWVCSERYVDCVMYCFRYKLDSSEHLFLNAGVIFISLAFYFCTVEELIRFGWPQILLLFLIPLLWY